MTARGRAESARVNSMRYSGSLMCSSREAKSSGLTTRRLEGTMGAFICESRRKPATSRSIRQSPASTVTVSPTSAAPTAR